jgi:hypothetical protein
MANHAVQRTPRKRGVADFGSLAQLAKPLKPGQSVEAEPRGTDAEEMLDLSGPRSPHLDTEKRPTSLALRFFARIPYGWKRAGERRPALCSLVTNQLVQALHPKLHVAEQLYPEIIRRCRDAPLKPGWQALVE